MLLGFLMSACNQESENTFLATGIIEGTAVKIAAQTGGYIEAMHVDEGQKLEIGTVIAVIDSEKYVYRLQQVEAGLREIEIQAQINRNILAKAESDYQHFETKYQRFQDLFNKNSASQQTVDDLKLAYDNARTQLDNARMNLQMVQAKRENLIAQANLLRRQIRDAEIISPLSGTVTTKFYEGGETVPTGFAVVEIIDLSEMWIKVYISEKRLGRVNIGQSADIHVDGTDQVLEGRVAWISPRAEFTPKNILTEENRTALVYAVKVIVSNPDGILKHGMPVEVELNWQ